MKSTQPFHLSGSFPSEVSAFVAECSNCLLEQLGPAAVYCVVNILLHCDVLLNFVLSQIRFCLILQFMLSGNTILLFPYYYNIIFA